MEYNFSNSKYFYEMKDNSIIIRKRFLTSVNAIITFILSLILIIALTQILFDQDVYKNNLYITFICMLSIALYFFTYSLASLFWMPKLYIFSYDHFVECKTNNKYFYDQIEKIAVAPHISSATFRIKYKIDHLCLEIHINNSKKIKVVDIEDKKSSEELNNFKILIQNLILKSKSN